MYTKLEWQILTSIWRRQPTTSREIRADLSGKICSSPGTIKTVLHRLVEKGEVGFRRKGNRYLYSARNSAAEGVAEACSRLVQVVFDGQPASAIAYLASSSRLSYEQATYLQELLAEIQSACQQSERREAEQTC